MVTVSGAFLGVSCFREILPALGCPREVIKARREVNELGEALWSFRFKRAEA